MRAHWKPTVALLLAAPFLTELLSGNLPASVFFRPQVYLFLATVGYGFPILLLREFAVRRQLGLASLFLLGLAYGIFNEGIIAKTFYLAANVPIKNFDGYGYTLRRTSRRLRKTRRGRNAPSLSLAQRVAI